MATLLDEPRHSMRDAAKIVGVSIETLWRWTLRGVRGRVPKTFMVGGRRYVTHGALEDFIAGGQSAEVSDRGDRQRRAADAGRLLDGAGAGPAAPRSRAEKTHSVIQSH